MNRQKQNRIIVYVEVGVVYVDVGVNALDAAMFGVLTTTERNLWREKDG